MNAEALRSEVPARMRQLAPAQLAPLFGASKQEQPQVAEIAQAGAPLTFYEYSSGEQQALSQRAAALSRAPVDRAGPGRRLAWERGWADNLARFQDSGFDTEALVPRYFQGGHPVRLLGRYVKPAQPDFYLQYTRLFTRWLFRRWFAEAPSIYEFGCGPGAHLAQLARLFPSKPLHGLDWASASQQILSLLAVQRGLQVTGHSFDFFDPRSDLALEPGAAALTFGGLEQVGTRFAPFLEYLLEQPLSVCLHVEGLFELYSERDAFDRCARDYHEHRGYLRGFLPALQKLEQQGRVEILSLHRSHAGVFTNDTYSYVAWRKIRPGREPRSDPGSLGSCACK